MVVQQFVRLGGDSGRLRVCHVTTVHPRYDTRILLKECRSLSSAGYDVHLVVSDGLGREEWEGVTIHDAGVRPQSRIRRLLQQRARAERLVMVLQPDVVHVHDPELLPLGVELARRGMRVIYDAHEDVPSQIRSKDWIPRALRWAVASAVGIYEGRAVRRLAGVVAATPHIEKRLALFGTPVACVNNFPLPDELFSDRPVERQARRVCYVGSIAPTRGVTQIVRALPFVPGVRLTLCGAVTDPRYADELRREDGWAQVDYLGVLDREGVRRVLQESTVGLVTFLPIPNHLHSHPIKLFEYMSAGLPVIGSHFPLWRRIVEDSGAGICVDPASPREIAAAIESLIDDPDSAARMGSAGRRSVLEQYNWPTEACKLLELYAAFK